MRWRNNTAVRATVDNASSHLALRPSFGAILASLSFRHVIRCEITAQLGVTVRGLVLAKAGARVNAKFCFKR